MACPNGYTRDELLGTPLDLARANEPCINGCGLTKGAHPPRQQAAEAKLSHLDMPFFEERVGRVFVEYDGKEEGSEEEEEDGGREKQRLGIVCRGVCSIVVSDQNQAIASTAGHAVPNAPPGGKQPKVFVLINKQLWKVAAVERPNNTDFIYLHLKPKNGVPFPPAFEIDLSAPKMLENVALLAFMPPNERVTERLLFDGKTLQFDDATVLDQLSGVCVLEFRVCNVDIVDACGVGEYANFKGMSGSPIISIDKKMRGVHLEGIYQHHRDRVPSLITRGDARVLVKEEDQAKASVARGGRGGGKSRRKASGAAAEEPAPKKKRLSWSSQDFASKSSLGKFMFLNSPILLPLWQQMGIVLKVKQSFSLYGSGKHLRELRF